MIGQAPDLLTTIVAATRARVEAQRARVPAAVLAERMRDGVGRRGAFAAALSRPDRVNVIAECKRRSPSKGVLRRDYDAAAIARDYERAGAAAISVLTEPTFFDGHLDHLRAVRAVVDVPILRKDFIVDEYQLLEARAAGADAALLIVAALDADTLGRLHAQATALGLDVLVEVHDEHELERAAAAGARIIGVNNRNLRTLAVDVDASRRLVARLPGGVIAVAESGLRDAEEIDGLRRRGYHAFLIGERLVTAPQPGEALAHLLGARAADEERQGHIVRTGDEAAVTSREDR
jgi:indole-3-glycerol phosphate synthase